MLEKFLAKEFEDVPVDVRIIVLQQLEAAIRDIYQKMAFSEDMAQGLHAIQKCAIIYSCMEFLRKFKRETQNLNTELTD